MVQLGGQTDQLGDLPSGHLGDLTAPPRRSESDAPTHAAMARKPDSAGEQTNSAVCSADQLGDLLVGQLGDPTAPTRRRE